MVCFAPCKQCICIYLRLSNGGHGAAVIQPTSVSGPQWRSLGPLFREPDSCRGSWLNPAILAGSAPCQDWGWLGCALPHTTERAPAMGTHPPTTRTNKGTETGRTKHFTENGLSKLNIEFKKKKKKKSAFCRLRPHMLTLSWAIPKVCSCRLSVIKRFSLSRSSAYESSFNSWDNT